MIKARSLKSSYICTGVNDEFRSDKMGYCGSFDIHNFKTIFMVNKTVNVNHQLPDIELEKTKSSEYGLDDHSSAAPTTTSSDVEFKPTVKFSRKGTQVYEVTWITDTLVMIRKNIEEAPSSVESDDNKPLGPLDQARTGKDGRERKYRLTTESYYKNLSAIANIGELWVQYAQRMWHTLILVTYD